MNAEQGFRLHPEAAQDITDIWEFIAEDSPLAARRVREEILEAIRRLVPFAHQGHKRPYMVAAIPESSPRFYKAGCQRNRSFSGARISSAAEPSASFHSKPFTRAIGMGMLVNVSLCTMLHVTPVKDAGDSRGYSFPLGDQIGRALSAVRDAHFASILPGCVRG